MSKPIWRAALVMSIALVASKTMGQTSGPLRVCQENGCWLLDSEGSGVFLTGSHTWANRQERGVAGQTPDFDYERYLDFLDRHGHNFIRLWAWEHAQWMQFVGPETAVRYAPSPWLRTGPGTALDGKPKFDLDQFNPEYFHRLRQRVEAAQKSGIYVAVMFFQGFSLDKRRGDTAKQGNAWHGHLMNKANNVNGIDGNPSGDDSGRETHTLQVPEVTRLQEAYVRHTIEAVGDLDNVLWEIGNECHKQSVAWQYHMIDFIRDVETGRPMPHLIGMTGAPIANDALVQSPADWISPIGKQYLADPPTPPKGKIVIADTDHLNPWRHDPVWVWKNLLRGNHFILMDGYMDYRLGSPDRPDPAWDATRRAMGLARRLSERVDLRRIGPKPALASTGYCLAAPGHEYLVYQPKAGKISVQVDKGEYRAEWIDPTDGEAVQTDRLNGNGEIELTNPLGGEVLLWLQRID